MDKQNKSALDAINYMEKLYREIAQLITTFNKMTGEEWKHAKNSSAVTYNNSQSIDNPERWLSKVIAKYFRSNKKEREYMGIAIILKKEETSVPIILAGKLNYNEENQGETDFELLWFEEGPDNKSIDGKVYELKNDKYNYSGKLFACPLFEIKNKEDIKTKIFDKIMEL